MHKFPPIKYHTGTILPLKADSINTFNIEVDIVTTLAPDRFAKQKLPRYNNKKNTPNSVF